jgi:hypothetical protein
MRGRERGEGKGLETRYALQSHTPVTPSPRQGGFPLDHKPTGDQSID